ncbi:hypothetical protein NIES4075_72040 [Tolypothrix sp. NIES-4075]|uniref:hypothetical protein n=1 Tax=Tolypothrix sp. NIES-4075 TaxID=2005459 RepID=UPI000B5C950D|nr:hypothetical protein [Tolypothrix sp. NIES-4075]GAX46183.1 hypothetical protein NIES4075_72040 [Tolypothrix sp. NIES-4075]
MSFIKGLGKFAGQVVGGVVGGSLEVVGELVDSKAIKQVGKGVYQVAATSGEVLGSLTDGVVTTVHGAVTKDGEKVKQGLGDAGNGVVVAATGVGQVIKHTAMGTASVVRQTLSDEPEQAAQQPSNQQPQSPSDK